MINFKYGIKYKMRSKYYCVQAQVLYMFYSYDQQTIQKFNTLDELKIFSKITQIHPLFNQLN